MFLYRAISFPLLLALLAAVVYWRAGGPWLFTIVASGAIAALKKDLDPIGCFIVGAVAGIGGGTVRDLILGRNVFWLHDKYLYSLNICFLTSLVFYIFGKRLARRENIVNWFDAVGLSLFAVLRRGIFARHMPYAPAVYFQGRILRIGRPCGAFCFVAYFNAHSFGDSCFCNQVVHHKVALAF